MTMMTRRISIPAAALGFTSRRPATLRFGPARTLRHAAWRPTISASLISAILVVMAMATSSIVFSEPAIADILMLGVIVGVPVLGVAKFGRVTMVNLCMWLAIIGLGLLGGTFAVTFKSAVMHQIVTLYLVLGAVVLAGYIAADAERRFRLVMVAYVVAALVATVAGLVGYFRVFPSAFDLFTSFGRARGTFKDPNVYGAAIAPALVACAWMMLRENTERARIALVIAVPLMVGMLLCFSRGAWISLAVSFVLLATIAFTTSRRQTDMKRFRNFAIVGTSVTLLAIFAVLQVGQVRDLLQERASLDQSYDHGPEGRFGGQQKARQLIIANPLGIGTHTFREVHHKEEPHNAYLSLFLNAGWLGGFLYIVSVVATLAAGIRGALQRTALQGPFLVAVAAFAGVAVEGAVIDSEHWRSFFILMACVWGLADAPRPVADPSRRREDRRSAA